jgi:hypothetical protein
MSGFNAEGQKNQKYLTDRGGKESATGTNKASSC